VPELQLLVPQAASAARGPQPAQPFPAAVPPIGGRGLAHPQPPSQRRRDRMPLWSETLDFNDSFFAPGSRFENSGMGDLRPLYDLPSGPLAGSAQASTAGQVAAAAAADALHMPRHIPPHVPPPSQRH
jgi:hypothetical protein